MADTTPPTLVWTRLIDSNSLGHLAAASSITIGADGSIYLSGYVYGSIDGQPSNDTVSGKRDAFVTKYTSDGAKVWTRQLGTNLDDVANALTTGLDGSIYVGGSVYRSLDGQTYSGSYDAFITKYTPDGNKVWTRQLGSTAIELAQALTTGLDGSIFISGYTTGSLDGQTTNGEVDAFVTKYTPEGNKVWTRQLGTKFGDIAYALATGLDGSIFVSGVTSGSLDGQTNKGGTDAFITKYTSDGVKVWTRLLGTNLDDVANALTTGLDGSIYLSGYTTGSLDGQTYNGGKDVFITQYKPDGTKVWTRLIGNSFDQTSLALRISLESSIIVAGNTTGSLNGQPAYGNNSDPFLMKWAISDTLAPQIAIVSNRASLGIGESAEVTFTLSKISNNFTVSDISVLGGTLSNFQGSDASYKALFTPFENSTISGVVRVASGVFSDASGNNNADGSDANNLLTLAIDTVAPTIAISSNKSGLQIGDSATLTFTLSEASTSFVASDVAVNGGTLSNFSGSGTTYTALFTPTANSTTSGTVSVASGVFTDTAGNANADGSDANNIITLAVDTVVPTIALSSAKSSLIAGETTTLTFTLSEASTTFTASDVTVTGGALSNFAGSGATYTALFTPTANSTANATVSVASGVFTDTAGNANADGSDANNLLTLAVDTLIPTIAVSSNKLSLQGGDSATLTFTMSEASTSFVGTDVVVTGGTLSNFTGSGTSYTATYTLGSNSTLNGTISVANGVFTDAAGNKNADGSDANNSVNFSRIPTITNEIHTLSVIVDKNVLGASATLLKELKESITLTNGAITKHIVEYSGLTFDYSQIDSLITTVTRDGEFTAEFTKEINDYLGTEQNITYSAAVAIVGSANIDGIILSVAGADGNFVG